MAPVGGDLDGAGLETFGDYTILDLSSQDAGSGRGAELEADLTFAKLPGRGNPDRFAPGQAAPQTFFSLRRPVSGQNHAVELG